MNGIILEEVHSDGVREVARVDSGELTLGREPDNTTEKPGVALGHTAISREHGVIMRARNHWFYKDLGSTNGSWINGKKCEPDRWGLIRSKDYIQLADVAVRIRSQSDTQAPNMSSSLIIFRDGVFADEFPIPSFGRALVVGGSESDLDIRGDIYEKPSLVVERRGENVCCYNVAKEYPLTNNGETVSETVTLIDRDLIRLCEYDVIVNDSASSISPDVMQQADGGGQIPSMLKSWGEGARPDLADQASEPAGAASRPLVNPSFGKKVDDDDMSYSETASIDQDYVNEALGTIDGHPSARFTPEDPGAYHFSSHEDKIILFVGFILFLVLMVLVVWWVLV